MDVFLVYHLRMFKKSLNISFITCFVTLLNCLSLTLKQQQILILLELNAGCHNRLLSVIRIC